jgi:hypothetical protein
VLYVSLLPSWTSLILSIDCDSTIQIPGGKAPLTDCTEPCAGNSTEICGASGRLSIYTSGAPSPSIVAAPTQGWNYLGCFTYVIDLLALTLTMLTAG